MGRCPDMEASVSRYLIFMLCFFFSCFLFYPVCSIGRNTLVARLVLGGVGAGSLMARKKTPPQKAHGLSTQQRTVDTSGVYEAEKSGGLVRR